MLGSEAGSNLYLPANMTGIVSDLGGGFCIVRQPSENVQAFHEKE